MNSLDLCYASIEELSTLIQKKRISPTEVVSAHIERIEATESSLNSFITLRLEEALIEARIAEKAVGEGRSLGVLHGIPLGLKDLYDTKGIRTTSGIKVYDTFISDHDSTVTTKLANAGAILMGKTNMAPLAMRGSGRNEFYGHARNPWDTQMVTGGSSSGSGSAASAGQCTITLGSDTGGSVRIPASFCGLVGLKPTYGLVSRYGVKPLSWSLDHPGPMVRTVADCAIVMNVISGYDPKDPTSANLPAPDFTNNLKTGIKGLRIGVPREFFDVPLQPDVAKSTQDAISLLTELGADVREVSWPNFYDVVIMGHIISMVEASANYGWMGKALDSETAAQVVRALPRLETGLFVAATDYLKAQQLRHSYTVASHKLMDGLDILAGPTMPMTAFPITMEEIELSGKTLPVETAIPTYTRPFNHNGFPCVTVPCGFSSDGLPIGLQLAGKPYEDATVLRAAYAYEQSTEWHLRRPPV